MSKLASRAAEFGVDVGEVSLDFAAVMARMRRIIGVTAKHDDPARFRALGVDVHLDQAAFDSPDEIVVSGKTMRAKSVIIATGSRSATPPLSGLEDVGYITHVEALELERLPRSVVIVGGGPVGCEFAQIFARFGARVSMVCSSPLPLPKEDAEVRQALKQVLEDDGVVYHGGVVATAARRDNGQKLVVGHDESGQTVEVRGEEILVAAGRDPTVDGLNLQNAEGGGRA